MVRFLPRLVAMELTGSCNLMCRHCRASAAKERDPEELATEEIKNVIADIASFSKPIIILTGGEPLLREDIFELVEFTADQGLRPVLGTNGTLIDDEVAVRLRHAGVKRVSVSIDCAYAGEHDAFRGVEGAYEGAVRGIEACKRAGLEFQVNTTVTRRNLSEIREIHSMTKKLGAVAHHLFLLVPTGRGKALEAEEIPPQDYEDILNWMYEAKDRGIYMRATCAPHYVRVAYQRGERPGDRHGMDAAMGGCMAGRSFAFVSRKGEVNPCGYLPLKAGNVREKPFHEIWENSRLFINLRNRKALKGKCGQCEFRVACGGCRARAYARYGDYMEEEPYCVYVPRKLA